MFIKHPVFFWLTDRPDKRPVEELEGRLVRVEEGGLAFVVGLDRQ